MTNPEFKKEIVTKVRFTPEEYELHSSFASAEHVGMTDFIREALEYFESSIHAQQKFFQSTNAQFEGTLDSDKSGLNLDELNPVELYPKEPINLSSYRNRK